MAAPTSLLVFPLIIGIVGDVEIETLRILGATGSSVLLPGLKSEVEFKGNMIYELRKLGGNPSWLMMDHGEPHVHKVYENRGQVFPENKSFLLTNLTEKDNGIYEQKLNQRTLLRVILTVIDPVENLDLRIADTDNVTCRVSLLCDAGTSDSSNVTFLRNAYEIKENTSKIENDHLLVIDGTNPQHWGIYKCRAKNLVSQKDSQEMELIPERISGGYVFFCIGCIGGVIYICHHLCLLVTICQKDTSLSKLLFSATCILGTSMESSASSIFLHVLFNSSNQTIVIGGIIVIIVILMVRALWLLMLCGLPLHPMIIRIMEDALFAADLLLVPAIYIQYIWLYLAASDLCGLRNRQILWTLLQLVIGFVILLAVVLPLRILWVKCRPGAPDPHKGSFALAPDEDGTVDINEDERKNEGPEKETQSGADETPT
ncbi:uncharacterized protein LOC143793445 [Ranitomeya variabilis]|uniref:uncharacterized protein LOC143793444 n=1 Tax=Ranitomeya variabilis TaxID=490064 RepID=UPI004055D948